MHLMWRATTYLYLTAILTAVLVGSTKDILVGASLAGVLAVQAAMHHRRTIPEPVAHSATASHTRPLHLWSRDHKSSVDR
jgi:hypothetical protein